jgi:flavin reductase (DIM6/NTAB) family NADH-FMN oxidoreductase RutF
MNDKTHQAMGMLTYGIYILTTHKGGEKHGMIVSWVSQVSNDPPLVMAAIRENRRMHPIVKEAGAFVLHVLDTEEKRLISRFKLPSAAERFATVDCSVGETGAPIIKDGSHTSSAASAQPMIPATTRSSSARQSRRI